jgi:hypothetical protein
VEGNENGKGSTKLFKQHSTELCLRLKRKVFSRAANCRHEYNNYAFGDAQGHLISGDFFKMEMLHTQSVFDLAGETR